MSLKWGKQIKMRSLCLSRIIPEQPKPHGFMITNGTLSRDGASQDAYREMVAFFRRTLTCTIFPGSSLAAVRIPKIARFPKAHQG